MQLHYVAVFHRPPLTQLARRLVLEWDLVPSLKSLLDMDPARLRIEPNHRHLQNSTCEAMLGLYQKMSGDHRKPMKADWLVRLAAELGAYD